MVVAGILLAKGLGFYRDMVFAKTFGTGVEADIYFQIFGLVNLIFTGIGVALSTLVIKNINKSENLGKERAYVADFLRKTVLSLVVVCSLMALFAPTIVNIVLPEISGANLNLAVKLTYVMIPSLMFVVVAYVISGVLQNERVFFITSVMSLPFNAVIIIALMIPGISILNVGIVTTIGWFLHILILLPSFYKKKYLLFTIKEKSQIKKDKNFEILWIFISNMMFQICFYTDRAFVVGYEGMAATFNYASNLFVTISSVFVVAMSTVVFPSISKNYEEGNIDYVNELLRYIITIMTAIFLPFIMVAGLFGTDVIRLVYERGSFTSDSTVAVAIVFFVYSLGILGYVSQELFNKIMYLAGKYKHTVIGTVMIIILNLIFNIAVKIYALDTPITGSGFTTVSLWITITTSLLLIGYAVVIAFGIKKVVGPYFKKDLVVDLSKIFISGGFAILTYFVFNIFLPDFTHGKLTFVIPLFACAIIYLLGLYITGILKKLMKKI